MAVETRLDAAALGAAATPPVNVNVPAMDSFIPISPDANPNGMKQEFKYSNLTKIEGGAAYKHMCIARKELLCNTIAIKSTFRGYS